MNLDELYFPKQCIDGLSIHFIGKIVIFFKVNKSFAKLKTFIFQASKNANTHRSKIVIDAWELWYDV